MDFNFFERLDAAQFAFGAGDETMLHRLQAMRLLMMMQRFVYTECSRVDNRSEKMKLQLANQTWITTNRHTSADAEQQQLRNNINY